MENSTVRHTGLVLYVTLHYTNIPESGFSIGDTRYFYRVHQIMQTPFEQQHYLSQDTENTNYGDRKLITRNGVHIKFVQSGQIGRFSFKNLLVNMLAVTGLMSVITMVCDTFAESPLFAHSEEFLAERYLNVSFEEKKKQEGGDQNKKKKEKKKQIKEEKKNQEEKNKQIAAEKKKQEEKKEEEKSANKKVETVRQRNKKN
jgi:hypothetical protein